MTDTVSITCSVFALPPPTITWTDDRNSSVVANGGRFSILQTDSGNTRTSILTFNGILKQDESNYTCTAVNNVTNAISTLEQGGSIITVQGMIIMKLFHNFTFCTILVPTTVIRLTAFSLQLSLGGNVTLRFSLSNDDPLVQTEDIRWFFVSSGIRTEITNSSDSRHSLSADRLSFLIDGITHSDEGEYILEATNAAGTGSNSVILSVTGDVCVLL